MKNKNKISLKSFNFEKNLKSDIPISSEDSDRLFKLSFNELIIYYLCCKENKKTLSKIQFFHKALELIDEYIDISNSILLNQKIETLKIILLDYHEIEIFDSIYRHSFNKKIGIDLLPNLTKKSLLEQEIRQMSDSKKARKILNFIQI